MKFRLTKVKDQEWDYYYGGRYNLYCADNMFSNFDGAPICADFLQYFLGETDISAHLILEARKKNPKKKGWLKIASKLVFGYKKYYIAKYANSSFSVESNLENLIFALSGNDPFYIKISEDQK